MLVVSGIAEAVKEDNEKNVVKGQCYGFNLFLKNEELDSQLEEIESYMMARGWDNIVIQEQEFLDDTSVIEHSVMQEAISKAQQDGLCGVFNHTPLEEA